VTRLSPPVQTGSEGPPNLLYNGFRIFPAGKGSLALTTHLYPLPRLKKEYIHTCTPPCTVMAGL